MTREKQNIFLIAWQVSIPPFMKPAQIIWAVILPL